MGILFTKLCYGAPVTSPIQPIGGKHAFRSRLARSPGGRGPRRAA